MLMLFNVNTLVCYTMWYYVVQYHVLRHYQWYFRMASHGTWVSRYGDECEVARCSGQDLCRSPALSAFRCSWTKTSGSWRNALKKSWKKSTYKLMLSVTWSNLLRCKSSLVMFFFDFFGLRTRTASQPWPALCPCVLSWNVFGNCQASQRWKCPWCELWANGSRRARRVAGALTHSWSASQTWLPKCRKALQMPEARLPEEQQT